MSNSELVKEHARNNFRHDERSTFNAKRPTSKENMYFFNVERWTFTLSLDPSTP